MFLRLRRLENALNFALDPRRANSDHYFDWLIQPFLAVGDHLNWRTDVQRPEVRDFPRAPAQGSSARRVYEG
jgi:hypothetical protein